MLEYRGQPKPKSSTAHKVAAFSSFLIFASVALLFSLQALAIGLALISNGDWGTAGLEILVGSFAAVFIWASIKYFREFLR